MCASTRMVAIPSRSCSVPDTATYQLGQIVQSCMLPCRLKCCRLRCSAITCVLAQGWGGAPGAEGQRPRQLQ